MGGIVPSVQCLPDGPTGVESLGISPERAASLEKCSEDRVNK